MGKRELFIAIGFILIGVVVYQFTAPAPKPDEHGFSFTRFWSNARRGMNAGRMEASVTQRGTFPVTADMMEVRVEGMRTIHATGENRSDIAYELEVVATGPDMATASKNAQQTTLKEDDVGSALTLRTSTPPGIRQAANLTIHLPSRLGLRVSGASSSNGVDASGLASLYLENGSGDSDISQIAGTLGGMHRNGYLKVRGVGSVKMSLQQSRATFEGVQKGVALDLREGECRITAPSGDVDIDERRTEVEIIQPRGWVRVGGSDGRVSLEDPQQEARIDVRGAEVDVRLAQAVPLTLFTTDDTLRLDLDGPPPVVIDAVASLERIRASDFGLQPESVDQESRLSHDFGHGGPRVSLRNLRGDIVIGNSRGEIVIRKGK
jgi:hypothetical protein